MNRATVEKIQRLLAEEGDTLETLFEFCGNKNTAVTLTVPGREHAPVYFERFGNDGALVTEEGLIIGEPIIGAGHEFYLGQANLDRVCAIRTTIIPTGFRDNRQK